MNPTTGVPVTRLPPGLPAVVVRDGTRCLVNSNTVWIPANFPPGSGYQQPRLLQSGVKQVETGTTLSYAVQLPPCSGPREMMHVCQLPVSLPSSELDLQLLRPEAFSCALPSLDLPRPVPHTQSVADGGTPVVSTTSIPQNIPKTPIPSKRKPELKPCKRKPSTFRPKPEPKPHIPKEKVRKPHPESKPYFVPQPLGAKHIKPQSRTLGDRITKPLGDHGIIKPSAKLSFAEELLSADSVLSSTGSKALAVPVRNVKDKVVLESERAKSGHVSAATVTLNPDKAVDRAEPNSADEYDVEYLYLTKLILRKKKKAIAEPSKDSLPSRKRKCPDHSSEVPQAMKQARLEEPQDSPEDLEALLAEYSSSLSSRTRDFF